MQGAWVQSLVREPRFHMPCSLVKKLKKKKSVDKDAQEAKGILKKKKCMDKDAQEAREYEPNL